MRHILLIYSLVLCHLQLMATDSKSVCLNMIVKDESEVICRCLASVKPMIDYWVIVDTGSTDKTQEIIKNFMKDIPGELHERPWVNFGHNRNEALELAKGKADYTLIIDADEQLIYAPDFKRDELSKDFYYITTEFSGTNYERVQLVNNQFNWKWTGVLHETIGCPNAYRSEILLGVKNLVSTDGCRSKDPQKYQKDALVFEKAILEEPNNSRYVFYLAQSYKDAGEFESAIKNYKRRIAMGGWDKEIFWAKLQIAILEETLAYAPDSIEKSYLEAYTYRPTRAEPLYRLASYLRRNENYQRGYEVSLKALGISKPKDILFVESWIYDYGLLLEYSICAYWTERFTEAFLASQLMLANTSLPQNVRECVERNLVWIKPKLPIFNESYCISQ